MHPSIFHVLFIFRDTSREKGLMSPREVQINYRNIAIWPEPSLPATDIFDPVDNI